MGVLLATVGVVVGLGLNVDTARGDLPLDTATSLRAAGAPGVDRASLLTAYLVHLARVLGEDTGPGGVATGVDDAGRLTVRSTEGVWAVSAGDVVHVRAP